MRVYTRTLVATIGVGIGRGGGGSLVYRKVGESVRVSLKEWNGGKRSNLMIKMLLRVKRG